MDCHIYIIKISIDLSIMYFKRSQVKISKIWYIFITEDCFYLGRHGDSTASDEMLHYGAHDPLWGILHDTNVYMDEILHDTNVYICESLHDTNVYMSERSICTISFCTVSFCLNIYMGEITYYTNIYMYLL